MLETMYPLLTLMFYCVMASYSFRTTNLSHWVVGNAFLLCVNICIFTVGGCFHKERYSNCIRSMLVTPASRLGILLHEGFFSCFETAATVFIGFFIGCFIFGVDFSDVNLGLFLLITMIAMSATTGLGLFLAVFGLVFNEMHFVLNLTYYVLMIFCGAEFPIAQLPAWAQVFSKLLPLTRSIEAASMLFGKINKTDFSALC